MNQTRPCAHACVCVCETLQTQSAACGQRSPTQTGICSRCLMLCSQCRPESAVTCGRSATSSPLRGGSIVTGHLNESLNSTATAGTLCDARWKSGNTSLSRPRLPSTSVHGCRGRSSPKSHRRRRRRAFQIKRSKRERESESSIKSRCPTSRSTG